MFIAFKNSALKIAVDVALGTIENKCGYYSDGKYFYINNY